MPAPPYSLLSPLLGELPFDGGFQHGGPITLQFGLRPLQGRHPSVQIGKEFLDLGDNATLLLFRRYRNPCWSDIIKIEVRSGNICFGCGDVGLNRRRE